MKLFGDQENLLFFNYFICYFTFFVKIMCFLRKGNILEFKSRSETILRANNDPIKGTILTDKQEYSTDFINRWINFGFVKIKNK